METKQALLTRRSIRAYSDRPIGAASLQAIVEAGIHAPYGRNQIWRFALITESGLIKDLAELTIYKKFVATAKALIVVFYDQSLVYHDIKDAQTMGACIQNMLLAAHDMGLGAVWIGEILKNEDAVRALCEASDNFRLSAVLSLGWPARDGVYEERDGPDKVVFFTR
jgi:nitroreductase